VSEAAAGKTPGDALMATVGREIHKLRKARRLTLEELSRRADVSVGLISQIERGRGNPSFNTLVQLAHALDTALPRLMLNLEEQSPVVRKNERRQLDLHSDGGVDGRVHELMTPSLDRSLEVVWVEEPPGSNSKDTPYRHPGEEVGVILEGHHIVWLDGVPYELGPGDAITYPSSIPHWYENPGTEVVRAIWIITPPTF
jgi:transcriptional regulator with XRE-family HTH domain